MEPPPHIRLHAYLSGRVQGVGMRATVLQLAIKHDLTGWVRNLSDGRVELQAEGPAEALRAFVEELRELMGTLIRELIEDYGAATGESNTFRILY